MESFNYFMQNSSSIIIYSILNTPLRTALRNMLKCEKNLLQAYFYGTFKEMFCTQDPVQTPPQILSGLK